MFAARAKVVLCLLQLLALKVSYSVLGLESVHVKVPIAVLVGSSVTLICECDLPDEDLYSVKWYKGKHEFFRYTSKEIPSIKIFPKAGISVDVNLSNASHLVLVNAEPQSGGKYSCEITEAAPSFHTKIATRTMNVVDPPTAGPQIVDMKPFYGADEFLEVACTSSPSLPAAKLEWLINDLPLPQPMASPSRLEFFTLPAADALTSPGRGNKPSSRRTQLDKSSQQEQQPAPGEPHKQVDVVGTQTVSRPSLNRTDELSVMSQTPASGGSVPTRSGWNAPTSSYRQLPIVNTTILEATGSTSWPVGEHRKTGSNNRYELSVSRLKLLLEHGHFPNGKLKVECVAHIFDLYRRSSVASADENYPQVRVLSNSDNGVHFSFMSDKDDAPSSSSWRCAPPIVTVMLGKPSYFISATGTWVSWLSHRWTSHSRSTLVADTGQPGESAHHLYEPSHLSSRDASPVLGCILFNTLLMGLGSLLAQRLALSVGGS